MESQDNKNDQTTQREAESNSIEGLQKSPDEQASFQQGGQEPGNSQGGQGGNQTDHGAENPRHDKGDELSEFAREDS